MLYNPSLAVFAIVVMGVGLAALTVLANIMLPDFVRRARDQAAQRTGRAFLIGLINFVFFGLVALALLSARSLPLRNVGVIVATIMLPFVVLGVTVIALWVGERLRPNDASATRQVLAGIVTLELAELFPFVGWIVVPLFSASIGLGAVILALFQRKKAPAVS
jgi:MFS family permease